MKTKIKIQYLRNQIIIYILNLQKFNKAVSDNFQEDECESILGFTIDNIIYLNENNLTYGILIHEIVHAVNYIMSHHNIQDEESRAYLSEYIFEQLLKFINKKKLTISI